MTGMSSTWHPAQPHNHLPALPPRHELESRVVLKACIEARAALAELKQAAELIPNQAMLINTIPLLEAKDSSEIENIVTTTDQLFQFAQGHDKADPATKEALRYRTALHQGFESLKARPLCTSTAVDICRTLKGVEMDIRRTPGTQLANDRTEEVVYTPPEGEARLREMLANWERFLHHQIELDPLIRMAVGHYQFEAIHPFTDGNGRTGRVLNILYLIQEELLGLPILYLSRHVIAHKADYYRLLLGVTLYFNAYTEDLFTWDNDLENDSVRGLKINQASRFFDGFKNEPLEPSIDEYLKRYADFDFDFTFEEVQQGKDFFSRPVFVKFSKGEESHIKISRGEQNIFIWCVFMAICEQLLKYPDAYLAVKHVYIDDPISSLDDNNAIAVACDLAQLLRRAASREDQNGAPAPIKVIFSTHPCT